MTNSSPPLVAIGVPSGDMVHADFAMSLANMCFNAGARAFLINAKSSLIMLSRNQIIEAARAAKATHVLFLDSDMVFPVTLLSRLLAHNKDIAGAMYVQRVAPHYALGVTIDGRQELGTENLQRMKSMPTGCILLNLSIFDRLPKPWFNTKTDGDKIIGEDYYFCEHAIHAGYDIWCDAKLSREIAHIGQKHFDFDTN